MAAKNKLTDNYASQAVMDLTESAANTLTFQKLETGLSVYDKIGWVINRVEWRLGAAVPGYFNASGDTLTCALTMSNGLTALADQDPSIYITRNWWRFDYGTAASGLFGPDLWTDDFSTLPGGGLLVLPNPIYLAIKGNSLTTAASVVARIFFTAVELNDQDYFNLVQARQLLINA